MNDLNKRGYFFIYYHKSKEFQTIQHLKPKLETNQSDPCTFVITSYESFLLARSKKKTPIDGN